MNYYMIQSNQQIKNEGYINMNKVVSNTWILLLNPQGFNPNNDSKIQMVLEVCKKYQIYIILLNETNIK